MASSSPWIAARERFVVSRLSPLTLSPPCHSIPRGAGRRKTLMAYGRETTFESGAKKAHLTAVRKKRLKLPTSTDRYCGYDMSEFLSLREGVESALNVKAAKRFERLDNSTYRVVLPNVRLLGLDACPVMDLRVTTTAESFTVKMLSFKFQGAEALERENDRLKGLMVSRIMWPTKGSDSFLELKMQLDITMELVRLPFSLLPPAAVEIPGNLIMQAVVDNLTKELLENVVEDYKQWMMKRTKA